jgi:hypothetical protein
VPRRLFYTHVRSGGNLLARVGAAPVGFATAIDRHPGLLKLLASASFFAACGIAVSLTFWYLALKDE